MNENKTKINCLACIYGDYHLNLYKMGISKNWDLASFNKKEKNSKKRLKYTHFWEKLGYWLVVCRHIIQRGECMKYIIKKGRKVGVTDGKIYMV